MHNLVIASPVFNHLFVLCTCSDSRSASNSALSPIVLAATRVYVGQCAPFAVTFYGIRLYTVQCIRGISKVGPIVLLYYC